MAIFQFFLLLLSHWPLPAAALKVVLASDPWCPFTCGTGPSNFQGVMVDLASAALATENIQLEYRVLPWTRAIAEARAGTIDGVVGALVSDVPDFVFPLNSEVKQQSCFYVLEKNNWSYSGPQSLQGKKLGLVRDYSYGPEFDLYLKKARGQVQIDYLSGTDTARRLFEKLEKGRFEVVLEDQNVASYNLKQLKIKNNFKKVGCLSSAPLYVAFGPANRSKSQEFAQALERGMKKIRASGLQASILKNYNSN